MLISNINETDYKKVSAKVLTPGQEIAVICDALNAMNISDEFICTSLRTRSAAHNFASTRGLRFKTSYVESLKGFKVKRIK